MKNERLILCLNQVSVPYRGATFLNMNNNFEFKDWSGFRPLSGSYISQSEEAALRYKLIKGFRPLSGSYISQLGHLFIGAEMGGGFRPLSGSYISQCTRSCPIRVPTEIVSVPYRGATFLNK